VGKDACEFRFWLQSAAQRRRGFRPLFWSKRTFEPQSPILIPLVRLHVGQGTSAEGELQRQGLTRFGHQGGEGTDHRHYRCGSSAGWAKADHRARRALSSCQNRCRDETLVRELARRTAGGAAAALFFKRSLLPAARSGSALRATRGSQAIACLCVSLLRLGNPTR
jgi:hypothetical protein